MILSPDNYDQQMAECGLTPAGYDVKTHKYVWVTEETARIEADFAKDAAVRVRSVNEAAQILADVKIKALTGK